MMKKRWRKRGRGERRKGKTMHAAWYAAPGEAGFFFSPFSPRGGYRLPPADAPFTIFKLSYAESGPHDCTGASGATCFCKAM